MARAKRQASLAQVVAALAASGGNVSAAGRALRAAGYRASRQTIARRRDAAAAAGHVVEFPPWTPSQGEARPADYGAPGKPLIAGQVGGVEVVRRPLPARGRVRRYILAGATNNTPIHAQFWRGLEALADRWGAEILIRRLAYNLNAYRRLGAETELTAAGDSAGAEVYYAEQVRPHICEDRVELAPGLHWCGDIPITATAADPLSGLQTISGAASGIFAATSVALEAIATPKHLPAKMNFTTGAVTMRNYSRTKTGEKARWHHAYAALLVEVDSDGDWFARQLIAGEGGRFNDLGLTIDGETITPGDNLAAITLGDIHAVKCAAPVRDAIIGPGGLVDQLRPRELHTHDLHDHESRNHHTRGKPFERFRLYRNGRDTVLDELKHSASFLALAARDWLAVVVVDSNHHDHLERYLQESDWRDDPPNMRFHLRAAERRLQAIEEGERDFLLFEWACREAGAPLEAIFLRPDQSHVVEGVECGQHGHNGPNGARGSVRNLARMGSKSNIGHGHGPGIRQGCWMAGVTGGDPVTLDMGYNKGPGNWVRAHIGTYIGGKRTMIIMRGLKFRAEGEIERADTSKQMETR